ncbi:hypothetical protein [Gracilibacillus dipsosauri]|uniref:hypothetical protein n=1 Tax=Gracilibacillus dipsosauri TaxID=178340 RepID=UPI00240A2B7F
MEAIQKYYQLTKEMLSLLNVPSGSQKRKELIDHITEMIDNRQQWMEQIKAPYTQEEEELGKQTVILDRQLNDKLQQLFQSIKKDMRNNKKQQRSNTKYLNPYQSISTLDGRFMDSKK